MLLPKTALVGSSASTSLLVHSIFKAANAAEYVTLCSVPSTKSRSHPSSSMDKLPVLGNVLVSSYRMNGDTATNQTSVRKPANRTKQISRHERRRWRWIAVSFLEAAAFFSAIERTGFPSSSSGATCDRDLKPM